MSCQLSGAWSNQWSFWSSAEIGRDRLSSGGWAYASPAHLTCVSNDIEVATKADLYEGQSRTAKSGSRESQLEAIPMANHASQSLTPSLRETQRLPRSCTSCASRKVKCDKAIPCATCIKRGDAASCARETVLVRGQVKTATLDHSPPTYEELLHQNRLLREELGSIRAQSLPPVIKEDHDHGPFTLYDDNAMRELMHSGVHRRDDRMRSTVASLNDIYIPSREVSEALINYDRQWNSWVHCATEYPRFQEQHDFRFRTIETGISGGGADLSWLATYLSVICASLIMMKDEDVQSLQLKEDRNIIAGNWYEGAILCLQQSNFMRIPHLGTVQTIAVLGMCFQYFGDGETASHLWSCAIRVAQRLGLGTMHSDPSIELTVESQRRLWWTFIIVEWLDIAGRPPQVDDLDFDVPLPSLVPSEIANPEVQAVHYHRFMATTAKVHMRFRLAVRRNDASRADAVRLADVELADVITTLPHHLQPDLLDPAELQELEHSQPWIKWQRFSVTLVLLHLRMRVHSSLNRHWAAYGEQYAWAKSVAFESASRIIWISYNWDQPAELRNQWALSFHVFGAATLFLSEWSSFPIGTCDARRDELRMALQVLDSVGPRNAIASRAASIVRSRFERLRDLPTMIGSD